MTATLPQPVLFPPNFACVCEGTGFVPDPEGEPGAGWVVACSCAPDGGRHVDPERVELPF